MEYELVKYGNLLLDHPSTSAMTSSRAGSPSFAAFKPRSILAYRVWVAVEAVMFETSKTMGYVGVTSGLLWLYAVAANSLNSGPAVGVL